MSSVFAAAHWVFVRVGSSGQPHSYFAWGCFRDFGLGHGDRAPRPSHRLESKRAADAVDDEGAVPHRQDSLDMAAIDLHIGEAGTALEVVEVRNQRLDLRHGGDVPAIGNAA